MTTPKIILTIAGSDSGAGAGIQGDLKTISALNGYGVCAIVALTAQNTMTINLINDVSPAMIISQITTIFADFDVSAIKIGMLNNIKTIIAVKTALTAVLTKPIPIILDPVMIAKSNLHLLNHGAINTLISELFVLTTLLTPNLVEAEILTNQTINNINDAKAAAQKLINMQVSAVLIKGLQQEQGNSCDLYYDGNQFISFTMPLVKTNNNHGTGCTLSSAIATFLAQEQTMINAIALAKTYLTVALKSNHQFGHGHGPINHFVKWKQKVECEINDNI